MGSCNSLLKAKMKKLNDRIPDCPDHSRSFGDYPDFIKSNLKLSARFPEISQERMHEIFNKFWIDQREQEIKQDLTEEDANGGT